MKKGLIVIIILAVLAIMAWTSYNGLVTKDNAVGKTWANVQNQYQSRADLVPNLVETVKGAAAHEEGVFKEVTEARSRATQMNVNASDLTPEKLKEFQANQGQLSAALGRLLALQENYPTLKVNDNFLRLQDDLNGIESRIRTARKDYNDAIENFNNKARRFPTVLFANLFGLKAKPTFNADEAAQKAPKVDFSKPEGK